MNIFCCFHCVFKMACFLFISFWTSAVWFSSSFLLLSLTSMVDNVNQSTVQFDLEQDAWNFAWDQIGMSENTDQLRQLWKHLSAVFTHVPTLVWFSVWDFLRGLVWILTYTQTNKKHVSAKRLSGTSVLCISESDTVHKLKQFSGNTAHFGINVNALKDFLYENCNCPKGFTCSTCVTISFFIIYVDAICFYAAKLQVNMRRKVYY